MSSSAGPAQQAGPGLGASIVKGAAIIAVATLLARLAGFLRTLVFSHSAGTTVVGDTYQTINTLPNVVFEVAAGGVLAAVAVPIIGGQLGAGRRADADQSASALLTWALVVLLPISLLLMLAAPRLSDLLLNDGRAGGTVALGARMLVLFAPQVVLYGIGIVLTGVLQAHRRFLAAAVAPLLSSLVVIGSYLAYAALADAQNLPGSVPNAAVLALAGGTTLGVVVLSLPLFVPAWRAGVRLRPTLRFPPGSARRAGSLAGAGVLALVAQQAAVFATLWLTHHRTDDPGTVNVYAYVQAVYLLPYAVLAVPIATAAFPALARRGGQSEVDGTQGSGGQGTLARALQGILVLCGGAAAVLVAVAGPVGAFFRALDRGEGAGGNAALAAMPDALQAYAPGLVGFGAAALLTRAMYVRGHPVMAALAVAAGWAIAALWPLLTLPDEAGASGTLRSLGAASSVGMTVTALLLAVLVHRAWGAPALAGSGRTVAAVIVATALSAAAGDVVSHAWVTESLLDSLAEGVAVAVVVAAVYLVVLAFGDRSAMRAAVERGRRRRGRA